MSTLDTKLALLEQYPAAVKQAIIAAGDDLVDVIGTVHSNQARIREIKRNAVSELEPGDTGSRWRMEQGNAAKRSYNDSALLMKLSDEESILKTLMFLIQTGVVKLSWSYTNLMKLVRSEGIDLSIAQHEIADGDDQFDIGEIWAMGSPSFKPVDDKEK